MYKLQFDGATNPNPGPMGVGAVLYDTNGTEVASYSNFAGDGTNNQSEYLALIAGLRLAISENVTSLVIQGDSKLVINQVEGAWQCNKPELKELLNEVLALFKQFEVIRLSWIPRNENSRADNLSKMGLTQKEVVQTSNETCTNNNVLPLNNNDAETEPEVIYHAGIGFSVIAKKKLFCVNINPIECSCGGTKSAWCLHISAAFDFAKQHRKSA